MGLFKLLILSWLNFGSSFISRNSSISFSSQVEYKFFKLSLWMSDFLGVCYVLSFLSWILFHWLFSLCLLVDLGVGWQDILVDFSQKNGLIDSLFDFVLICFYFPDFSPVFLSFHLLLGGLLFLLVPEFLGGLLSYQYENSLLVRKCEEHFFLCSWRIDFGFCQIFSASIELNIRLKNC